MFCNLREKERDIKKIPGREGGGALGMLKYEVILGNCNGMEQFTFMKYFHVSTKEVGFLILYSILRRVTCITL